jgi:glycosyltransferase involved in cell wall biosynthesis
VIPPPGIAVRGARSSLSGPEMSNPRTLVISPSVSGIRLQSGRVVLNNRLLSGIAEHARSWDGHVVMIVEPVPESELEVNRDRMLGGDNVEVDPADLPFECHVLSLDAPEVEAIYRRATIAMAAIHDRQTHLVDVARRAGIPLVYVTEYTLRTRLQIALANLPKSLRLARHMLWVVDEERRYFSSIARAAGVQCNGVPTYDVYRRINGNAILYFDSRISEDMLAPRPVIEARLDRMRRGEVLRLGFSGRLNRMKGADELVLVAHELRKLGVPFTLDIWGGGVLADDMQRDIQRLELADAVRLHGFVAFDELVPVMQREIDAFLCCHVQGDPSSTYIEAFTNGLPVLGYANEALAGLLEREPHGASAPIRDRAALARVIADAWRDRERLAKWSLDALALARDHTFDRTFRRRNDHLEEVVARARR